MKSKPIVIIVLGQTASGKSDLAIKIASRFNGEIISADSVQVYRRFDIGSAKIPKEKRIVAHHLIDIKDPDQAYSAVDFVQDGRLKIKEIASRGKLPIIVGGTNFYIKELLYGSDKKIGLPCWISEYVLQAYRGRLDKLYAFVELCDPKRALEIDMRDKYRLEKALCVYLATGISIRSFKKITEPEFIPLKIAILRSKEQSGEINERTKQMFSSGLVEETRSIINSFGRDIKPLKSIGYKQASAVIDGHISLEDAVNDTIAETLSYSKRQMTWLKKEENLFFFETGDDSVFDFIKDMLSGSESLFDKVFH